MIRASRAGGHTAQCLFVDLVPKPGRGFLRSDGDECFWHRRNPDSGALLIIATHVDDSLCLTNDPEEYAKFVAVATCTRIVAGFWEG